MTTTSLDRRPPRRSRSLTPYFSSPLDRFFKNDFSDFWDGDSLTTVPPINVTEEKNNYLVSMAVPGFKKEDFDIDLDGDLLTISCEKETDTDGREREPGTFSRREYNYSSFSRTVTLPDHADNAGIKAKYDDGVLKLTIPKKPEAQKMSSKKIQIE
jgi:HSP20 family protein